jgi:hypothetical protein
VEADGSGFAPRKSRVCGVFESSRDSRPAAGRGVISIPEFDPKPPLAGDFRHGFPDFEADFPSAATHCDEYVCLLQQVFGKIATEGNYDNFGIALGSRKGTFVATKMNALITSR